MKLPLNLLSGVPSVGGTPGAPQQGAAVTVRGADPTLGGLLEEDQ